MLFLKNYGGFLTMKRMIAIMLFTVLLPVALSAQSTSSDRITVQREKNVFTNPSDNEFIGKLGTGYASDPGKFGLDVSLSYIYNLDPVFVFGFEGDFFWINWNNKLDDVNAGGAATGSLKAETNLYTFPIFADAQVRFPFLRQKIYVEPSVTVGLGYCFMILDYTSDADNGTDFYSGFAWQIYGSAAYKLIQNSAVDFVLDLGYRSIKPDKDNIEIDMSGVIARLGVRFYI